MVQRLLKVPEDVQNTKNYYLYILQWFCRAIKVGGQISWVGNCWGGGGGCGGSRYIDIFYNIYIIQYCYTLVSTLDR